MLTASGPDGVAVRLFGVTFREIFQKIFAGAAKQLTWGGGGYAGQFWKREERFRFHSDSLIDEGTARELHCESHYSVGKTHPHD